MNKRTEIYMVMMVIIFVLAKCVGIMGCSHGKDIDVIQIDAVELEKRVTVLENKVEDQHYVITALEIEVDKLSVVHNKVYKTISEIVPRMDEDMKWEYTRAIVYNLDQYEEIDYELVMALIWIESRYNPDATSPVKARGPGQIMPFWADKFDLTKQELYEIEINIPLAFMILDYYLTMAQGDMDRALCLYSGYGNKSSCKYSRQLMKVRDKIKKHGIE